MRMVVSGHPVAKAVQHWKTIPRMCLAQGRRKEPVISREIERLTSKACEKAREMCLSATPKLARNGIGKSLTQRARRLGISDFQQYPAEVLASSPLCSRATDRN